MSASIILDGDVRVRKETLKNGINEQTGVDTGGRTFSYDVGAVSGQVHRLLVRQSAGPVTDFTVEVFDNNGYAEEYKIIGIEASGGSTRVDIAFSRPVPFENSSSESNLYVKIVPASGSGHSFQTRIQGEITEAS